jgi:hypothetical protein
VFNKRKNKTFNYNSRFSKDEIKDDKITFNPKQKATEEWKRTRKTGVGKRKMGLPLLLLLLGIIIAIMYYLEYKL